jgi:hypothetical protein
MTGAGFGRLGAEQVGATESQSSVGGGPNDLSAYYGFEEIEIIKLDWGIDDLRVADFDGDGRTDIAVVNNRKARIELLVQKPALGPGERAVAVAAEDVDINQIVPLTRFAKQSVAVSQKILSFVCGDLNSDGMQDLAFYAEPKGLYVTLQKASEGESDKTKTLLWRSRKKINIDDGLASSNALVCADLNNDGADDLVLAGRDGVYLVVQDEDGSLAEPKKYPTTSQTLGVTFGDLNGDGINDLILVTNDSEKVLHVRFGLASGQLGPQMRFFIERPRALKLHDIDGSGGHEVLTVEAVSGRLGCYRFSPEKEQDVDWPMLFYPLSLGKESSSRDLAAADFDGDGLVDVAVSEPGAAELILYKQVGQVGLAEPVRFPALADISSVSSGDVDGDGRPELAVISVKEKVIGLSEFDQGRLSFPRPIDVLGEPLAMALADVDHDGGVDCVYVSRDTNDARFLRVISNSDTSGGQSMTLEQVIAYWQESGASGPAVKLEKLTSNPDGLKVVDVDQDGLEDVLIFVKYDPPILVRQMAIGNFEVVDSPKAQASLIKEASLSSVALGDVDGKVGDELLLAQKNFARSLLFADGKSWTIVDQYNAKSPDNEISAVGAFDITGVEIQNRPAIVLLDGQKGQLQILRSADDKTYRFEKQLEVGKWNASAHLKMLSARLTGDTSESILLFDSEKFALVTAPTADNVPHLLEQRFSYETKIKDGSYGNLVIGDINGDERSDIIMVEYKRNHMEVLALDSGFEPLAAMRFKIFEQKSYRRGKADGGKYGVEPRQMKLADVTGDGKNDLVTVIHDRIIVYPQD